MQPLQNEDLHYMDMVKVQYERMAHHENQRFLFSSLVMTVTTTLLTILFAVDAKLTFKITTLASVLLIIINIFAILFIIKSRYWIKLHQGRARHIIEGYNPRLAESVYNDEGSKKQHKSFLPRPPLKLDSNKDYSRRPNLQILLHLALIIAVFVFAILKYAMPI
ncbi:hypothetical protein [Leclercia adecarboxylata]|uniref:hypothetical protein n=1 Tax=Leclercia adecarboxylata TaxID=83655 RepID=UPI0024475804|nr:hypothetical protein [Leclercia adecarboxylata]MDH0063388.1 hypothetical protein [Leclercia adecarboxylata]